MDNIKTLSEIYELADEQRAKYIDEVVRELPIEERLAYILPEEMEEEELALYHKMEEEDEDGQFFYKYVEPASQVVIRLKAGERFRQTYCYHRIHEQMGLTEDDYTLPLSSHISNHSGISNRRIFFPDGEGNICILVYDLEGNIISYPKKNIGHTAANCDNTEYEIEYCVTRYSPEHIAAWEEEHPGQKCKKYNFPSKKDTDNIGHFPFFPPKLMKKYQDKEEIQTLVLTEGYLKAMSASLAGIDIVGLGSVTLFKNPKTRELYADIKEIIRVCKVKRVIVLYDGDCRNLSEEKVKQMKDGVAADLSGRPHSFESNLRKIREELVAVSNKLEVYFSYTNSDTLHGEPKGIDDLLNEPYYTDKHEDIVKELIEDKDPGKFFFKLNLKGQLKNLNEVFHLDSVQHFYDRWKMTIMSNKFKYFDTIYRWNEQTNSLDQDVMEQLSDYIHVSNEFWYCAHKPSIRGNAEEVVLIPRSRTTVNDFFGSEGIKEIVKKRHYIDFINKPCHIDYHESIANHYNLYKRILWKPVQGEWPTINGMLKHIFPDVDYEIFLAREGKKVMNNLYKMALDYLTILWQKPMEMLPVLCLVSEERMTGKTSFLDLLQAIFGDNVAIADNSQIQSEFNSLLSGKLVVGVDETALADNDKFTERIKMWTTQKFMNIQYKGKDFVRVENFMKLILCSNNETNFIYTDSQEVRYWVIKVSPIPEAERIPNILEKFYEEIPAFLYFLSSRTQDQWLVPESETRMWFAPERTKTAAFDKLVEDSRSKLEKFIRAHIINVFRETQCDTIYYDSATLAYIAADKERGKIKDADDSKTLKILKSLAKEGKCSVELKNGNSWYAEMFDYSFDEGTHLFNGTYIDRIKRKCRPYRFDMDKWLPKEEYAAIMAEREANRKMAENAEAEIKAREEYIRRQHEDTQTSIATEQSSGADDGNSLDDKEAAF